MHKAIMNNTSPGIVSCGGISVYLFLSESDKFFIGFKSWDFYDHKREIKRSTEKKIIPIGPESHPNGKKCGHSGQRFGRGVMETGMIIIQN
jgi:hypothetical protein